MTDPLLDADGNLAAEWHCPDCNTHIALHDDPEHISHDWTRAFIAEHLRVHEEVLAQRHNGDRSMLRLALRFPTFHAAVIQVHGPIKGLTDEHRAQILRSAGIPDHQEGTP